jgi:hypothetical protein
MIGFCFLDMWKISHLSGLNDISHSSSHFSSLCRSDWSDLTYEERIKKFKLPTLTYRRKRGDTIEVFKMTSGSYDTSLPSLFILNNNSRTRGHSKKLYQHRAAKSRRNNFFTQRTVNIWNNLRESVISAKTTKSFESRLDKHWEAQELLYNYEADLTTGNELNSLECEDLELSIVVDGQRSEADL